MMEYIINTPERKESIIRLYKQEEIESMNYILGKPMNNTIFTKFELEACSKVDLFNRTTVKICKEIWKNKENPQNVEEILKEVMNNGGPSINNSVNQVVESQQV